MIREDVGRRRGKTVATKCENVDKQTREGAAKRELKMHKNNPRHRCATKMWQTLSRKVFMLIGNGGCSCKKECEANVANVKI